MSKRAIHIVDLNPDSSGSLCGQGPANANTWVSVDWETWYSIDSRRTPTRFVLTQIQRGKRVCGLCRRIMLARAKARGR